MDKIVNQPFRYSFFNRQLLVIGILLVIIGCLTIWRPFQSYLFISLSFAVLIILSGISEIIFAIRHKNVWSVWLSMLIGGVIDLTMGIYLLLSPLLVMIVLTPIISIWVFYKGFMSTRLSFLLKRYTYSAWWIQLIVGILIILISIIILANITVGYISIISWTGLGIILVGLSSILLSFVYWNNRVKDKTG